MKITIFNPRQLTLMNDFFNPLADFFAALTNEQKIFLGILSLLVFAFGVIVGWILQGMKTRRYKKEMLLLRKDRDEYEVRYRATEVKQKALAKELEAMSREKVDALDQIQSLRADVAQHGAQMAPLKTQVEELTTSNQSYAATIESLNDQVIGLKTQNEQLLAQQPATPSTAPGQGAGAGPQQGTGSNESLNAYIAMSESRFQTLENRLFSLAEENAVLRQGSPAPPEEPSFVSHSPVVPPAVEVDADGEPLIIRADTTEPGIRASEKGKTEVVVQTTPSVQVPPVEGGVAPENHDDLTAINNIGPFLQAKLQEHDIYRYDQIAKWSEADIVTYTELIGYLPGIIQRDDWVGQAGKLMKGTGKKTKKYTGLETPEPYVAEKATNEESDLQVIEGIGPKIESILKASGISTYDALADADPDELRELLASAGSRFKSHNPQTWPAQAGLAADGKLEELKAWQKELKGGV